MSRGLNKVMIIGNLGNDPEMRYTKSGRPRTTFRMAANQSWTSPDGESHKETEWFNVVAWGRLAETCNQYLKTGKQIYIEGRLHTHQWDDADGKRHSITEIVAQEMIMLGNRPTSDESLSKEDALEDEFPF